MGSTSDGAFDRGFSHVMKTVERPMRALMARPVFLGTLMVLPIPLYLVLGTSLGLRWWHVPWSDGVTSGLLWLMAADAALVTVLFGFFSALFFLGLWRGRLGIRGDKRPSMAYTYLVTPFQYGLIALWGIAATTGSGERVLLETGLVLYLISGVVKPWLKLLQTTESEQGAA